MFQFHFQTVSRGGGGYESLKFYMTSQKKLFMLGISCHLNSDVIGKRCGSDKRPSEHFYKGIDPILVCYHISSLYRT